MTGLAVVGDRAWAEAWHRSWDRQQEAYAPDREARMAALVEVTEAVVGPAPVVVDLGCGPGSLTRRLLARLPGAEVVAVDRDPVLLAVARASFAGDDRVRVVDLDVAGPGWVAGLGRDRIDAVLACTVTHYLAEAGLRWLYADCAGLLAPGGLLANADHMPLDHLPTVGAALTDRQQAARARCWAAGVPDWEAWWAEVERDPALADAASARRDRPGVTRSAEWHPPAAWHRLALLDAGFREAGVTHRWAHGALVAARSGDCHPTTETR